MGSGIFSTREKQGSSKIEERLGLTGKTFPAYPCFFRYRWGRAVFFAASPEAPTRATERGENSGSLREGVFRSRAATGAPAVSSPPPDPRPARRAQGISRRARDR